MINAQKFLTIRRAGRVKRMHTEFVHHRENLAEHSNNVAVLVDYMLIGDTSANLFRAALFHDLPEYETGDIPANTKWAHPTMEEVLTRIEKDFSDRYGLFSYLEPYEAYILKFADKLDLSLYCYEEIFERGNRGLVPVFNRINTYIGDKIISGDWNNSRGVELFEIIKEGL